MSPARRRTLVVTLLLVPMVFCLLFWASRQRVGGAAAEPIRQIVRSGEATAERVERIRREGEQGRRALNQALMAAADFRAAESLFDAYIELTQPAEERKHTGAVVRIGFGEQFRRLRKLTEVLDRATGRGARAFAVAQVMGMGVRDLTGRAADLLADPQLDGLSRICLIQALACARDPRAAAIVEPLCTQAPGGPVRAAAVRTLSKLESSKLFDVARRMLEGDPSPQARTAAAEALADCLRHFDRDRAQRIAWLLERRQVEESSLCRAALLRAAVRTGLREPALFGKVLTARSVPHNEKRAAARALSQIDSAQAVEALAGVLERGADRPTRRLVLNALRRMHTPESRQALARWTADPTTRPR
jgi:HEAT repeat protein